MNSLRVTFDENGRPRVLPPTNAMRIGNNGFATFRMKLGMPGDELHSKDLWNETKLQSGTQNRRF